MRSSLLALLLLVGCTASDDGETKETGEADADTDADTDTDTDTDTTPDLDRDGDTYPDSVDCDDTRADVNPGVTADICNGRDDDCDTEIDEDPDLQWYQDVDEDGFGKAGSTSVTTCDPGGSAFATNNADCDDDDANTWPGADDTCDGADNDCDAAVDEDEVYWTWFYEDLDNDGSGSDVIVYGCDAESAGGVTNNLDCDDYDSYSPVYVSTAGRRGADGKIDDPVTSIQSAINMTTGCVKVEAGTYYEDINFNGRNLTVEGMDGSSVTAIVGTGADAVVTVESGETDAVLRGFTISGGAGVQSTSSGSWWNGSYYVYYWYTYAYGGGAYVNYSTVSFEDVVFSANVLPDSYGYYLSDTEYYYGSSSGGAIYNSGGTVQLTDVDFVQNNASQGSAIYDSYSAGLHGTRVRMFENTGDYGTVYAVYGNSQFKNLIMDANSTNYGYAGLYLYGSTWELNNATLVGGEYGIYNYASTVTMDSSVVYGNAVGLYDEDSSVSRWSLSYNNVYGNGGRDYENVSDPTGFDGNLWTSPGFVDFTDDGDADNDDLTLSSRSGMIDMGNYGLTDPDGSVADIGAYGGPEATW